MATMKSTMTFGQLIGSRPEVVAAIHVIKVLGVSVFFLF